MPITLKSTSLSEYEFDNIPWLLEAWRFLNDKEIGCLKELCYRINESTLYGLELAFHYYFTARIHFNENNFDNSKLYLELSEKQFHKCNYNLWRIVTKLRLANDYVTIGKLEHALELFNEVFNLSEKLLFGEEYVVFNSIVLIDFASACCYAGRPETEWLVHIENSLSVSTQYQNGYMTFCAFVNLCINHASLSNVRQALVYNEKAMHVITSQGIYIDDTLYMPGYTITPIGITKENINTSYVYSLLLRHKGSILFDLGDYEKSIESYTHALTLYGNPKFAEIKAYIANDLAVILCKQNKYEEAIIHLNQSIEYFRKNSPLSHVLVTYLSNLAEATLNAGHIIEAQKYYAEALDLSNKLNFPLQVAVINKEIANIYINQGQYKIAIEGLLKAIEIAQNINEVGIVIKCFRLLGVCYMRSDTATAYNYLMKSLLLAEEVESKDELHNIYKEISTYYKIQGDIPQAFVYYEKHVKLREELFSAEADRKLRNLLVLYEVAEYKNKLEATTSKIKQLELEVRTRELSAMVISIMEKQELIRLLEKGLLDILEKKPSQRDAEIRAFIRNLRKIGEAKNDWEQINNMFLEVHKDYVSSIMKLAPDITPTELRTCVLVRLSMSTKQIAEILKLSQRSVENHRNHVRKKLGIGKETNLTSFLMNVA